MRFEKDESYDNKNTTSRGPHPDWLVNYKSWRRVWSGDPFRKFLLDSGIWVREFFEVGGKEFINELITPDLYAPHNPDFTIINPIAIAKNAQLSWRDKGISNAVNLNFQQPSRNFEFEMKRVLHLT